MKAIINSKLYDTDTAEKIYSFRRKVKTATCWWNPEYCFTSMHPHGLYKTAKGSYFEHDEESDVITVLTEREASEIVRRLDPDRYIELFGEVEEA